MLFFRMLHQAHFSLCCCCRLLFVLNFHIHECDWECNFFDFLRARIVNCVRQAQFETHSTHTRSCSFNTQVKITKLHNLKANIEKENSCVNYSEQKQYILVDRTEKAIDDALWWHVDKSAKNHSDFQH